MSKKNRNNYNNQDQQDQVVEENVEETINENEEVASEELNEDTIEDASYDEEAVGDAEEDVLVNTDSNDIEELKRELTQLELEYTSSRNPSEKAVLNDKIRLIKKSISSIDDKELVTVPVEHTTPKYSPYNARGTVINTGATFVMNR